MNIDNLASIQNMARTKAIKNYINGQHNVKSRKDFTFKNETFKTAKIVLQSIKSIVDFHSSYICGNPITMNGDKDKIALINGVYRKGLYNKTDYDIAKSIYTYGNAYEYVYKNEKGVIKSKIIRTEDGYPIYDENGNYSSFIEQWTDLTTNTLHEVVYTNYEVIEYSNGVIVHEYNNASGLPIHYTSGNLDEDGYFGLSIVEDLIPIMNEIELLLSKMTDSVSTLSLNPLGISIGDRVDTSIDSNVTGAVLNIESGGDFKYATANIDTNAITKILDNLISQFWTVAQVPSALYGQSNVANVSEVSLKLLFNTADNIAKRTALCMKEGINLRLEYISMLLGVNLNDIDVTFNYNRPVDNASIINDIKTQVELGIMSKETAMRVSPYIVDIDSEVLHIDKNVE